MGLPEPCPTDPRVEEILGMSVEEYKQIDYVLLLHSSVLGADIAIASNEKAAAEAPEGLIVYLAEEFNHLYADGHLRRDALRLIHLFKRHQPSSRMTGTKGMGKSYGMRQNDPPWLRQ